MIWITLHKSSLYIVNIEKINIANYSFNLKFCWFNFSSIAMWIELKCIMTMYTNYNVAKLNVKIEVNNFDFNKYNG